MRLKRELYKKEQEERCDRRRELIPDISKYFSFNSIKAVGEPHRIKRTWLSVIKKITKIKYTISAKDYRIKWVIK